MPSSHTWPRWTHASCADPHGNAKRLLVIVLPKFQGSHNPLEPIPFLKPLAPAEAPLPRWWRKGLSWSEPLQGLSSCRDEGFKVCGEGTEVASVPDTWVLPHLCVKGFLYRISFLSLAHPSYCVMVCGPCLYMCAVQLCLRSSSLLQNPGPQIPRTPLGARLIAQLCLWWPLGDSVA